MPELTEQEKLERRREKRKQRILASAENRLSRITGTAFRKFFFSLFILFWFYVFL